MSDKDPPQQSYTDQPTVAPGTSRASAQQDSTFPSRAGTSIVKPDAVAQLHSSTSAERLPRRFGDYLLLEQIAQGGMGIVYKARQESLNRIVAIKMILTGQLAGKEDIVRFYAEAEAAGKLNHPGVVPIYEVGVIEGQHFFSMGYVDGPSLSQLIVDHPIEPDEAAILTRQTAEAISYAHSQGVIHRDLKPANVLLSKADTSSSNLSYKQRQSRYGQPKVTDFGLAKQIKKESELTATGQILGTPGYMPPEQAAGRIQDIGPLADVYSLGGILYALTTGHAPFQAATPLDTLIQVLESDPVPPRQLNSKIPADLETICLKCLQKDMKRRYRSTDELIEDLNRFLDGSPITARPVTATERAWRWAKKRPAVALLGILSLGLLLVIAIAAPVVAYRQSQLRLAESIAKDQAIKVSGQLETAKDEAEASHYAANISLAYSQWSQGSLMRARQLLNEAPLRFRDWEWWFLDRICAGNSIPLRGNVSKCPEVAFTENGRLLAMTLAGVAKQWDVDTGIPCHEVKMGAALGSWNRTASRVINWTDSDALVLQLPQGLLKHSYSRPGVPIVTCKHAFDCSTIAILRKSEQSATSESQEKWSIEIVDTDEVDRSYTIGDLPSSQNPLLVLSPQAQQVAYMPDGENLFWADRSNGWKLLQFNFTGFNVTRLDFAPATQATQQVELLAAACSDGMIRIYRLPENQVAPELVDQLPTTGGQVTALAWDATGRWLAAGSSDRLVSAWIDREPNSRSLFRGVDEKINALAFSAESNCLAAASEFGVRAWKLPELNAFASAGLIHNVSRQDCQVIPISLAPLSQLQLSKDMRTCCALDESNRIFFIDTNSWQVSEPPIKSWLAGNLKSAPFPPPSFNSTLPTSIQLSPDGRTLAFTLTRIVDPGTLESPIRVKSSVVLWDIVSQIPTRILGEHDNLVTCMSFSPDGRSLVVGTGLVDAIKQRILRLSRGGLRIDERENELRVWDVTTGLADGQIHQQADSFTVLVFSPDGAELCSGGAYPSIDVWNWQKKILSRRLKTPAAVFPSALIWTELPEAITRKIYVRDPGQQTLATTASADLQENTKVSCCVAAGTDGRIRIYGADSGLLYRTLEGHTNQATSVVSLNQSGRIASSSEDGTVRVWDSVFGIELLSLPHDGRSALGLAWLPGTQSLLSLSSAGDLRVWRAGSDGLPDMDLWEDIFDPNAAGEEIWSTQLGRWSFDRAGFLQAETQTVGQQKGVGEIALARAALKDLLLPDTSLIEFNLTLPDQVTLMLMIDNTNFDGEMIELTTAPNPLTQRLGVSTSKRAGMQELRESVSNPTFQLMAGQAYQIKVLRTLSSLTLLIDDQPILRSQLPTALDCSLTLQAIYGKPGSKVDISNLRVRSTKPSLERRDAWAEIKQWLNEDLLVSRLQKRIDEKDTWSFELKRFAKSRTSSLVEDYTAINKRIVEWLESNPQADPQMAGPIIELCQYALKDRGRWQDWMLLAAVLESSGQFQPALDALKKAVEICQQRNGWTLPSTWGLVAACNQALGRHQAADVALHRANRCNLLSQEDPYWLRVSTRLKLVFGDRWNETGLSPQALEVLEFLIRNQTKHEDLYASDFRFQQSSGNFANAALSTFNRSTWIQIGALLGESGTVAFQPGDYVDVKITCDDVSAKAAFELVEELDSVSKSMFSEIHWQKKRVLFELRRSADSSKGWVIHQHSVIPLRSKLLGLDLNHDPQSLDVMNHELDQRLSKHRQLPAKELVKLTEQLLLVNRTADAMSVAQQLIDSSPAKDQGLILLSMAAMQAGEVEVAKQSAEKAIELTTSIAGPRFLQRMVKSKRGLVERVEVGKGFYADVPRTWRLTGREIFVGVENFQVGWLVEPPQAILSTLIKSVGVSPEQFIQQMDSADGILKRKSLDQRRFKVGDSEALWMEYVGAGNGGMIDGKGNVETHQVYVLLFLNDEILLITASSPENSWSDMSLDFQQMIQSLSQGS